MILTKEIYEGIQKKLSQITLQDDSYEYKESYKNKIYICRQYFEEPYCYSIEIIISKTCFKYLKVVLEEDDLYLM